MTRLWCSLACVGALVALAACGGDVAPAAVVNGTEISQQDVIDDLEAIEGNEQFLAQVETVGVAVRGATPGSFDAAFASQVLQARVFDVLVHQEIEAERIDISDECRQAARRDLVTSLGGGDPDLGEVVLGDFPEEYRQRRVTAHAEALVLQSELAGLPCVSGDAPLAYFEDNPDEFLQVCLTLVPVADGDEGEEVAALLETAAPGAPPPEGAEDLGCLVRSAFEPSASELGEAAFAADVGAVVGPIDTPLGLVVAQVNDARQPSFDEVSASVAQRLGDVLGEAFQDWFDDAVATADVEVDPRYGRWDPVSGQIVAPDLPAPVEPGEPGDPGAPTTTAPAPTAQG